MYGLGTQVEEASPRSGGGRLRPHAPHRKKDFLGASLVYKIRLGGFRMQEFRRTRPQMGLGFREFWFEGFRLLDSIVGVR